MRRFKHIFAGGGRRGPFGGLVAALLLLAAVLSPNVEAETDKEGGIGGTGVYFGPVTRLSSIVMNGETIALPDSLTPRAVVGVGAPSSIAPGETVFVSADFTTAGPVARQVTRFYPIVGRPDWSRSSAGALVILGTTVVVSGSTPIVDGSGVAVARNQIPQTAAIAVNGIWRNEEIVATRLVVLRNVATASVSGLVVPGPEDGLVIGGTRIEGTGASPLTFVTVTGEARGEAIAARRTVTGFDRYATLSTPQRFSASAYLSLDPDGQGYHLSGLGIPMDPRSDVPPRTGTLDVFIGRIDGRFLIEERR